MRTCVSGVPRRGTSSSRLLVPADRDPGTVSRCAHGEMDVLQHATNATDPRCFTPHGQKIARMRVLDAYEYWKSPISVRNLGRVCSKIQILSCKTGSATRGFPGQNLGAWHISKTSDTLCVLTALFLELASLHRRENPILLLTFSFL